MNPSVADHSDPGTKLLCTSFNQNFTALAVGARSGIRLFALDASDKLEMVHEGGNEQDVCIVERLFASSLLALVSTSASCRLQVRHFKKAKEICSYNYPSVILSVRLNRQHLVVCLAESIHVHSIRDMKVLHVIQDTPVNLAGTCALSAGEDESYLAYPGSSQSGVVQVFDAKKLKSVIAVNAHTSPLAAVAFSVVGNKMATASEKGTVIRVFSLPDGVKLFDFRRGLKRYVAVSSLAFSTDCSYVAASSNTETVHVFKLQSDDDNSAAITNDPSSPSSTSITQGWANYVTQALLKTSATYLPSQVADVFGPSRAFATARLPKPDLKTACGIASLRKVPHLFVATDDGFLHVYTFDPNTGGECTLVKQHRIGSDAMPVQHGVAGGTSKEGSYSLPAALDGGTQLQPVASLVATAGSHELSGPARTEARSLVVTAAHGSIVSSSCRSDASYAYKLKKAPRPAGPSTASQELNEIVDNVPGNNYDPESALGVKQTSATLNPVNGIANVNLLPLDDFSEFPPVS